MANSSKAKGDRGEWEAVRCLSALLPDHVFSEAKPMFGAGRKSDVGDLFALPDVAVQVKSYKASALGTAIISAAAGSAQQAANGSLAHGLGMVKVPRARAETVCWLAVISQTSPDAAHFAPVAEFSQVSKMLTWLRDDDGPAGYRVWDRIERVGLFRGARGSEPSLVMPIEAWTSWYGRREPASGELIGNFAFASPAHDDG